MVMHAAIHPVTLVLASTAVLILLSTIPYTASSIKYRHRDNGLAYLVLLLGVGVWNGMFAAQLLTVDPVVEGFFFALSVVGSVLAGIGFLLFATTASSTPDELTSGELYTAVGVLGGLDIALAVTTPAHDLYWHVAPAFTSPVDVASVVPRLGYWLHTAFLVALFGSAVLLFDAARRRDRGNTYLTGYVVVGSGTVAAVIISTAVISGGLAVGAVFSGGLTTIAWIQASRGRPLAILRDRGRAIRASIRGFRGAP